MLRCGSSGTSGSRASPLRPGSTFDGHRLRRAHARRGGDGVRDGAPAVHRARRSSRRPGSCSSTSPRAGRCSAWRVRTTWRAASSASGRLGCRCGSARRAGDRGGAARALAAMAGGRPAGPGARCAPRVLERLLPAARTRISSPQRWRRRAVLERLRVLVAGWLELAARSRLGRARRRAPATTCTSQAASHPAGRSSTCRRRLIRLSADWPPPLRGYHHEPRPSPRRARGRARSRPCPLPARVRLDGRP